MLQSLIMWDHAFTTRYGIAATPRVAEGIDCNTSLDRLTVKTNASTVYTLAGKVKEGVGRLTGDHEMAGQETLITRASR